MFTSSSKHMYNDLLVLALIRMNGVLNIGTVKDPVLAQIFCSAVMNDQSSRTRDHRMAELFLAVGLHRQIGLFGLRLDEAEGSFLGDEFGFSFPVFCFCCSVMGELFPLAQGEAVQAVHHYLLLQGSSGLLEVKVPRQLEELWPRRQRERGTPARFVVRRHGMIGSIFLLRLMWRILRWIQHVLVRLSWRSWIWHGMVRLIRWLLCVRLLRFICGSEGSMGIGLIAGASESE